MNFVSLSYHSKDFKLQTYSIRTNRPIGQFSIPQYMYICIYNIWWWWWYMMRDALCSFAVLPRIKLHTYNHNKTNETALTHNQPFQIESDTRIGNIMPMFQLPIWPQMGPYKIYAKSVVWLHFYVLLLAIPLKGNIYWSSLDALNNFDGVRYIHHRQYSIFLHYKQYLLKKKKIKKMRWSWRSNFSSDIGRSRSMPSSSLNHTEPYVTHLSNWPF